MAAKPKRGLGGKGHQKELSKRGRGSGRRSKTEVGEAMGAREQNGHEERLTYEEMGQPGMAASMFARMASEQFKQATGREGWASASPQVLGWATTGPAEQFETMLRQFWNFGRDGESSRYVRAMTQANVEVVELIGRRSKAYLDLPAHLARCRTPQQFLDEQTKFVQDMLHDYQATNDRLMNCWMEATTTPQQ